MSLLWMKAPFALLCTIATVTVALFGIGAQGKRGKAALVIIDMQDCFTSGGSLEVDGGNDIVPVINEIRDKHGDDLFVALSQDWHPPGHVSFASSHPGVQSPMSLEYSSKGDLCTSNTISVSNFPGAISCQGLSGVKTIQQSLWPDHCLQNVTQGPTSSNIVFGLKYGDCDTVIHKGTNRQLDSYSAFYDNGGFGKTTLENELRTRDITRVFVTGLAADFCVYYTSLDSHKLGYKTYYVTDATKPVARASFKKAKEDLESKGIELIKSTAITKVIEEMKAEDDDDDDDDDDDNRHRCSAQSLVSLSIMATVAIAMLTNKLL